MSKRINPVRLGTLWKIVRNRLVIKCERNPRIRVKVYDSSLREVGEIVNIFGPVIQPFAEVEQINPGNRYVGEVFYIIEKTER
ncbi:MAG: hypothetical protein QXF28_04400 [Nitrososphaerota archaeon]